MLQNDGHDRLELRLGHHPARRIVRVRKDERLRFGRDRLLQRFGREDEAVFPRAGHGDGRTARELYAGKIRDVAGVGHEDLVPFVADGAHDEVDALARAHGDEDVLGRVLRAEAFPHIPRDLFAQGGKAAVTRILGISALYALDRRVADIPRRDEIGLADAEGDRVFHFGNDVEKLAYPARLKVFRPRIDKFPHGCTDNLCPSSSALSATVPSILYFLRIK